MTPLLQVIDLVKHYRRVHAVNGVSFELAAGCCLGLLGPNGAGKTTTLEMLEGITTPTAGEIRYQGEPLGQRFQQEAGIMFQSTALQDYITVAEALALFRRFYPQGLDPQRLLETFSLESLRDRDCRQLSGGQRQRLLLAIALVNDPQIVFLDEPTTGLDPQARRHFWELINTIKDQGKTVILSTHYMEEAYVLCDRIAIMDHGKIITEGTPQALLADYFDDVILELPGRHLTTALPEGNWQVRQHQDGLEIATRDVDATLNRLLADGISLTGLQIRSRNLEDLFLALTGKGLRS